MADDRLPLAELMAKTGDGDFLRAVAESVLQIIMEADVHGLIGADRQERSSDRSIWAQRLPRSQPGHPVRHAFCAMESEFGRHLARARVDRFQKLPFSDSVWNLLGRFGRHDFEAGFAGRAGQNEARNGELVKFPWQKTELPENPVIGRMQLAEISHFWVLRT